MDATRNYEVKCGSQKTQRFLIWGPLVRIQLGAPNIHKYLIFKYYYTLLGIIKDQKQLKWKPAVRSAWLKISSHVDGITFMQLPILARPCPASSRLAQPHDVHGIIQPIPPLLPREFHRPVR